MDLHASEGAGGYLWEEVALRAPVQGRVTPTGDHQREKLLQDMRESYGPDRADHHTSRTRGSTSAVGYPLKTGQLGVGQVR